MPSCTRNSRIGAGRMPAMRTLRLQQMKGLAMSENHESPRRPSPKGESTPPTRPNTNRPRAPLIALCAVVMVILLSGCPSTNVEDCTPYKCNPNAGYPFIGDPPRPTNCNSGTTESDGPRPACCASEDEFGFPSMPANGMEFPHLDPNAFDVDQERMVFPNIEPHQFGQTPEGGEGRP